MMIVIDQFGNEREEDDDYVLRDGETVRFLRVPMFAMDALQREVASAWPPTLADAFPGRTTADARDDGCAEYISRLSNAWRTPAAPAANKAAAPKSASTGDPRTDAYAEYCVSLANRWQAR